MTKKTIRQEIRSNISDRLRPYSVVTLDRLAEVLANMERRLRVLERAVLPKSPAKKRTRTRRPRPKRRGRGRPRQTKKSKKTLRIWKKLSDILREWQLANPWSVWCFPGKGTGKPLNPNSWLRQF